MFRVNHLHFKTADPQKTAQWYMDYLGARLVAEIPGSGGPVGFRMELHGVPINITGFVEGQTLWQFYGLEHIALDTDELPSVVQKLSEGGARILEERLLGDGRKVVFFEGPDGVRLEVVEMRE